MTVRSALGVLFLSGPLLAQSPQPPQPPGAPKPLPPGVAPGAAQSPADGPPQADTAVPLPQKEALLRFGHANAIVRQYPDSARVYVGTTLLRDFGKDVAAAEEAARVIRALHPTEWGQIGGGSRPVAEYALFNGQAPPTQPNPKVVLPIDLKTVRAEAVRGVWVMADDANILLNFGTARGDAEQAAAVVRKYGFNRVGFVGGANPSLTYLYYAPNLPGGGRPANDPTVLLTRAAQEQALSKTGIPVPGAGMIGEQVQIDPRKVEVRKDRNEYVLAHGSDVLARFGVNEWSARDALKVVQDCRFTEFCRVGSSGVTFFLVNGQPPTRVPLSAQGARFDARDLRVHSIDGRFGVFEAHGRMLFRVESREEGEQLVRVIQGFGFDQMCRVGLSDRAGLKFLARTGR